MLLPGLALRARGYDIEFIDQRNDPRIETCDVLWLNRQTDPAVLEIARKVQARGARVIYEFDDNTNAVPHDNPASKVYGTGKPATVTAEWFTREADLVIVSTPDLAEEYRRYRSGPIAVCYNAMRDEDLAWLRPPEVTGAPKRPGELRIGWAGSGTHFGDLRLVLKPLRWALEHYSEARLVLVGLGKPTMPRIGNSADHVRTLFPAHLLPRVEFAGDTFGSGPKADRFRAGDADHLETLSTFRYYELIQAADFDLAIAPIVSSTFNRSKSWLKILEYGALGIPSIASNFGPYRQYVYTAKSTTPPALLAHDDRGWKDALERLLQFPAQRALYANAALEVAASEHALSAGVLEWEHALDVLRSLPMREAVA